MYYYSKFKTADAMYMCVPTADGTHISRTVSTFYKKLPVTSLVRICHRQN